MVTGAADCLTLIRATARRFEPDPLLNPSDPHWFVLHVRPCAEPATEARLRELDIETFLPLVSRRIRHATRTYQPVKRPLFPGYLFARFASGMMLRAVMSSHGVLRVLGDRTGPAAVQPDVIDGIRQEIGPDGCVRLRDRGLAPGDTVRVTAGPFWGWSGIFERELSDAARVSILIEMLQQPCRVVVRREALVPAGAR